MLRGSVRFSSIVLRPSFFFPLSSGVGRGGKEERERRKKKEGRKTGSSA
jgi:hypothetical protein